MDEQMIEDIARAMFDHSAYNSIHWETATDELKQVYRKPARAAHSVIAARVAELESEVARLRNILNEEGLVDDALAKLAGEPMDAMKSSALGPREFDAVLAPHPKARNE